MSRIIQPNRRKHHGLGGFQNDANTLLLFKPNANNGDTAFIDLSSFNRILTRYAPAVHSDIEKFVGSTSLLCDGSNASSGAAVIANSWNFAPAANTEFNIRAYLWRIAELTNREVICSTFSTTTSNGFILRIFNNVLNFIYLEAGVPIVNISGSTPVTKEVFNKVEVDRQEAAGIYTIRIRLNDSIEASAVYAGPLTPAFVGTAIGARPTTGSQPRFYSTNGYVDNMQISDISRI